MSHFNRNLRVFDGRTRSEIAVSRCVGNWYLCVLLSEGESGNPIIVVVGYAPDMPLRREYSINTPHSANLTTRIRNRDRRCCFTGREVSGNNFTGFEAAHIFPLGQIDEVGLTCPQIVGTSRACFKGIKVERCVRSLLAAPEGKHVGAKIENIGTRRKEMKASWHDCAVEHSESRGERDDNQAMTQESCREKREDGVLFPRDNASLLSATVRSIPCPLAAPPLGYPEEVSGSNSKRWAYIWPLEGSANDGATPTARQKMANATKAHISFTSGVMDLK
ncbi:hypothetical protein F5148DRAFT_1147871 [Russula earlei]|uniref:Uncharacterized protein n=1 Tax=Russula earlei TaxID=71964 RepID=A0ACC0UG34_9AGAM|nr:hypothetical protein F5148DRAFT_1147871 [Russula earlei]